ncbi:MAG TPA: VTT domain-containing protein [Candidatus Babeliales bacterium]|nr:VTT domain-containing protein [Candidatus Babeliales bacterium]
MDRKAVRRQIIIWCVLLILTAGIIVYFTQFRHVFTLENIHRHRTVLLGMVENHYFSAVALYLLAYILLTLSSLPVPGVLTLVGGFMFGLVWGMIYAQIAAVLASMMIFLIVRHVLGKRLQSKYSQRFKRFNRLVGKHGASYILLIQLTAIFPYFVVAFAAGITTISWVTFFWTTMIGILPGSYIYAFAGQKIGTINKISDIFTPEFYIAIAVFVSIILIAMWWRKHYLDKKEANDGEI